jgi:hypothetical protein
MKWYAIEVDEIIWNYLQKYAEPLTDTANSVLHRLLFGTSSQARIETSSEPRTRPLGNRSSSSGIPKALEQILEVVYEVVKMGRSRPDATTVISKRHGTAPQTILDKYCRQLSMKAYDFDKLLMEPGLHTLSGVLKERFPRHQDYIDSFLDSLPSQPPGPTIVEPNIQNKPETGRRRVYIRTPHTRTSAGTIYGTRKKRDPELEKMLKESLGNTLKENWGSFTLVDRSLLDFGDKKILCKYSSFSEAQQKWFWGVSKIYWGDWQENDHLALILEDGPDSSYSYLLLDSEEARRLFGYCSVSKDGTEKKISMRRYADDGKRHLQEWRNFDVEGRLRKLKTDWL